MNKKSPADNIKENQGNIGYQNTIKENDQDNVENNRAETTDTGHDEGPKENEHDTKGLRSESGSKSLGKKAGNKVR